MNKEELEDLLRKLKTVKRNTERKRSNLVKKIKEVEKELEQWKTN